MGIAVISTLGSGGRGPKKVSQKPFHIPEVNNKFQCEDCKVYFVTPKYNRCPYCGGYNLKPVRKSYIPKAKPMRGEILRELIKQNLPKYPASYLRPQEVSKILKISVYSAKNKLKEFGCNWASGKPTYDFYKKREIVLKALEMGILQDIGLS